MDRILIHDLLVRCVIGVNPEERQQKQDVLINIVLLCDLEKAGKSDRFEDTVDYRAVKKRIMAVADHSRYHLVEALAESIAALCLEYPPALEVTVRVEKPGALRFARSVGVEINRKRPSKAI